MNNLDVIFIVGFLVLGTYKLFELFVRKNERLAILEKLFTLSENKDLSGNIKLPNISLGSSNNSSWALRVSLLLMGIGIGCVLAFTVQYNTFGDKNDWHIQATVSMLYFSFIAVFGGAGLLIAYLIESNQAKKNK
jgi:hypothetical protein